MGKTKTEFLGVVSPVPKGDWQNNVAYKILNLVRYNTASYIAKKDVPPNIIPTNEEYWQLLAYDSFKDKDFKTINGQSIIGEGNIEIKGDGEAITVDDQLSSTSTNPVQNKVVFGAVEQAQNTANTAAQVAGNTDSLAKENALEIPQAEQRAKEYADEKAQTAIVTAQNLSNEYTDQKFNGASKLKIFNTYSLMVSSMLFRQDEESAEKFLGAGQIILFIIGIPLWVVGIELDYVPYTYTTDEEFEKELKEKPVIQIGHFSVRQFADLLEYAKTEYVDEKVTEAKDFAIDEASTAQENARVYTDQKIGDISTALDELHTYAQSLINGGTSQ